MRVLWLVAGLLVVTNAWAQSLMIPAEAAHRSGMMPPGIPG